MKLKNTIIILLIGLISINIVGCNNSKTKTETSKTTQKSKMSEKDILIKIAKEKYMPIVHKHYNFDFDPLEIELDSAKIEEHENKNYYCELVYSLTYKKSRDYHWYILKVTMIENDNGEIESYQATKSALDFQRGIDKRLLKWNDINPETEMGMLYNYNE